MTKRTLSSVTNALKILRLFSHKQKELSFTEIRHLTELPKSTNHRLISSLVKEGFLSRNPKNQKYRLGLIILKLGGVIFSHRELYNEALPIAQKLTEKLAETSHICFIENMEVTYLFRVDSNNPDRLLTQIGRKNPIHCTSEGLCILAYQKKRVIDRVIHSPLYAYTPHTLTEPEELKACLKYIRKNGYYVAENTYYENFISIAAPIRDYTGLVVSSLSVIGQSTRIKEKGLDLFINEITKAAKKISRQLGYYG